MTIMLIVTVPERAVDTTGWVQKEPFEITPERLRCDIMETVYIEDVRFNNIENAHVQIIRDEKTKQAILGVVPELVTYFDEPAEAT